MKVLSTTTVYFHSIDFSVHIKKSLYLTAYEWNALITVATWSRALWQLGYWDHGFESRSRPGCLYSSLHRSCPLSWWESPVCRPLNVGKKRKEPIKFVPVSPLPTLPLHSFQKTSGPFYTYWVTRLLQYEVQTLKRQSYFHSILGFAFLRPGTGKLFVR